VKNFKQFQEKLTHISVPLKKINKDIKSQPGDKPFTQEPGKKPKVLGEEGYDVARDMGKVPKTKDKKDATTMPPSEEMKKTQKVNKGPSAFDIIKKKYGKSVMKIKKK
jgi:hypothetical protein